MRYTFCIKIYILQGNKKDNVIKRESVTFYHCVMYFQYFIRQIIRQCHNNIYQIRLAIYQKNKKKLQTAQSLHITYHYSTQSRQPYIQMKNFIKNCFRCTSTCIDVNVLTFIFIQMVQLEHFEIPECSLIYTLKSSQTPVKRYQMSFTLQFIRF